RLRVFDIRDPHHPKEIAYFNAPIPDRDVVDPSNFAMSAPAFVPERGEIWYSDGFSGFYAVKVTNGVWPFAAGRQPAPVEPAPPPPVAPEEPGPLPATGANVPTVFMVTTALGALLLLWVLRGARAHDEVEV